MELKIIHNDDSNITLVNADHNIRFDRPKTVDIKTNKPSVSIRPRKSPNVVFDFVQRVLNGGMGGGVVRLTFTAFEALQEKDGSTWYAVTTDTTDELRYLYLGNSLIAKAKDDGGTWGFAYTFPITFGR